MCDVGPQFPHLRRQTEAPEASRDPPLLGPRAPRAEEEPGSQEAGAGGPYTPSRERRGGRVGRMQSPELGGWGTVSPLAAPGGAGPCRRLASVPAVLILNLGLRGCE